MGRRIAGQGSAELSIASMLPVWQQTDIDMIRQQTPSDFICIGHRGAAGYEPENTLRSIACALRLECKWIEFDVWLVDNKVVLFHDKTLKRTTNGKGRLEDKSFQYLRHLNAGKGEAIPTLQEAIDLVGDAARINIELKGPNCAGAVVEILENYVRKRGYSYDRFLVSSFDFKQLDLVRILNKRIKLALLSYRWTRGLIRRATGLGAYSLHVSLKHTKAGLIERAHSAGLKVFIYTVNRHSDILRMRAIGADGVFSDFPDRVFALTMRELSL